MEWVKYFCFYRKYMEINSFINHGADGWDQSLDQSDQQLQLISLYKQNQGRGILQQQYSLQPDMINGWMPKLPSCPIPLTYQNSLVNTIIQKIEGNDLFQIVYRGPRHINSVQLHKSNKYHWRYREKYDVKVGIIQQAVNNVGKDQRQTVSRKKIDLNKKSQIVFSSDFESGNLDVAVRIKKNEYDCFIRSDTNTKGHTNWYYFRVNNQKQTGIIQFNICNIVKQKNLYGQGMTPYTFQKMDDDSNLQHFAWRQNKCFDIQFVERICRYGTNRVSNQLQFKYDFKYEDMEVYFAYAIPYTYSYLQTFLNSIKSNPIVSISSLCQTFSGLDVPLIQISKQYGSAKTNLIVAARIHPGETNSSHMLQGFVKTLLEDSDISNRLLTCCNFYVIPMINPDGVVGGNYRTSFSGRDLNRKFNQIGKFLYPEINGLVNLVKKLKAQHKKVQFFFDFHSHSSKKDLFCYGPQHKDNTNHFYRAKLFTKILQKQDSMFDYKKCIYKISQYKKFTARAHMLFAQGIPMTYTFEISNGLYSLAKDVQSDFDKQSLLKAGKIIVNGLAEYISSYYKEYYTFGLNKSSSKSRKSMRSFNRSNHVARKSVGNRNNNGSCVQTIRDDEVKYLIQDIIKEKSNKLKQIDFRSDSQSSQNDIRQQELYEIFQQRKKYVFEEKSICYPIQNQPREKKNKVSLRKIKNKNEVLKKNYESTSKLLVHEVQEKKLSAVQSSSKLKKSRIYYEETHPPTTKKPVQNLFQSKKAIKQKKFPILF